MFSLLELLPDGGVERLEFVKYPRDRLDRRKTVTYGGVGFWQYKPAP